MPRTFAITAANETAKLDREGKGEAAYTVTNSATRPIRGQLRIKPLDSTKADWLSVAGEAERDFSPNATQQVAVKISVPAGTTAGKYSFRLDAISVANPDEDYTEGPAVAIEVKATAPPPKPFPWWVIVVAAVVLLVIGAAIWASGRNKVEVPDFTGKTVAEAKALEPKLEFELKEVEVTDPKQVGMVVSQDPDRGEKLKSGAVVRLEVGKLAGPEMVMLPNVVDQKYQEISPLLKGFTVKTETVAGPPSNEGKVKSQSLEGNKQYVKGAEVKLAVIGPSFVMPPLSGRTVEEALNELKGRGYNKIPMITGKQNTRIRCTSPRENDNALKDAEVYLHLERDTAPTQTGPRAVMIFDPCLGIHSLSTLREMAVPAGRVNR